MSTDARYILSYDVQNYVKPTPIQKDIAYLEEKYGGYVELFDNNYSLFWDKPKYLLPCKEIESLHADRILERRDSGHWDIIK